MRWWGISYPYPKHWYQRVLHCCLPVRPTGNAVCERKRVWELRLKDLSKLGYRDNVARSLGSGHCEQTLQI